MPWWRVFTKDRLIWWKGVCGNQYWKETLLLGAIGNPFSWDDSRPLTYVQEDLDSGFILTPGHFLATKSKLGLGNSSNADCHCDEDYQHIMDFATKLITKMGEMDRNSLGSVARRVSEKCFLLSTNKPDLRSL